MTSRTLSASTPMPCASCSPSRRTSSKAVSTVRLRSVRYERYRFADADEAFFASVLKDIRMERSKVRPSDNIRTFYLAAFFMDYLLALRRKELDAARKRKEKGMADEEGTRLMPLGLVGEMAEMDSVRWVVMRMKFSMEERVGQDVACLALVADRVQPPAWTELQASIDCFTQIVRSNLSPLPRYE